jgi:hypothetical protein
MADMANTKPTNIKPAPAPTAAPARRIFPLSLSGPIDLDAIKTMADLDAVADNIAASARQAIFAELMKRDPPQVVVVPAEAPASTKG